ncbi:Leo1-like protein [Yamadazyma tenuis ATCC 10573]|uniref:Leo1-like protein n=1 Tax=Candida tenuis (strain ATCC 10573 / BCRC 21748 / CBS 615 / JCM 9827 / NBRC 10315 / NRRL Y-1498 / VKM Y-70) TaxID=590646 RepID=G3BDI3_CANTC|nr:Leo1-like protein [Yamadazyma tenuis ATCC 10573]EGV60306.1 Leo1-like protein [Yamadazyma tenuis ATCC 10573]
MSEEELNSKRGLSNEEDKEDDLGLGLDSDSDTSLKSGQDNDGSDNNSEDESEEEKELKTFDLSVPRHAITSKPEDDVYHLKMPLFVNVDAHPFDPVDFKENIELNARNRDINIKDSKLKKNDLIREKLTNENTIRWKYSNENDEIIKQSNCHFVEWDDGSLSLKIGNEMFDFKSLPLYDNILVRSHDDLEILQASTILTKTSNLLPTSTGTSTHKQLANAIKFLQQKDKILNTITDSDPLEVQRNADENERKALKMKRQLELKRRLQEERLGRASPSLEKESYEEPSYERFNRTYNDEYDDEDDFIDNDEDDEEIEENEEDELDQAAERLRQVKEAGKSKYEKAGEAEDVNELRRKRRRIIDSDEEE